MGADIDSAVNVCEILKLEFRSETAVWPCGATRARRYILCHTPDRTGISGCAQLFLSHI
jgi:hypothetical protein